MLGEAMLGLVRQPQPGPPSDAVDTPTVLAPPTYITSDQLLDQAPPALRFSPDEERVLAAQLAQTSTIKVDCRLAAPTLAFAGRRCCRR